MLLSRKIISMREFVCLHYLSNWTLIEFLYFSVKFQETRDRSYIPMISYRHALLQRNKRCCLAYLYNRLQKLKEVRWHLGPTLTEDIKKSLTEPEVQWFNNYSKLLATYMYSVGEEYGINLTADIKPPKSLFIEVRCLADYGKFELESGEVINLKKNSQHYLPKSQCEALIRKGVLQHITN